MIAYIFFKFSTNARYIVYSKCMYAKSSYCLNYTNIGDLIFDSIIHLADS